MVWFKYGEIIKTTLISKLLVHRGLELPTAKTRIVYQTVIAYYYY